MQSHQFESLETAMKYLEERGTLKYWGWMGNLEGYYLYTFVAQTGIKYMLEVHKSGLVRIRE